MGNNRVSKLRNVVQDHGLDAILITSGINRRYLSGFTGSSGYVLITEEEAYLLTDFRYMTQASEQATGLKVVQHAPTFVDTVRELLPKNGNCRLGFEQDDVTYGSYASYAEALKPATLVPVSQAVEKLRMFKDEEELAVMRRAADLADDTFRHILKVIKPGMTERDVDLEMEFYMRSHGATASSFDTIVASGERSAMPHGVASEKVIQKGDIVTFDFGALLDGYCSDITRTIAVGDPGAKLKEIYEIVLESQLYALEHIKPGMTGREADALARDIIASKGYGDAFGHSLGHGLGMEVHEWPRLSMRSDDVLKPGMVVTVEPGIYVPGLGGVRIEDDVIVTETGVERLTHSSKEYIVL
ncbi:aminopeptidase P family protein [Paenibacillus sp. HN-1]|uniref:M24 family metallopeptidase n=1 Tax=Paenibacillus TaxID=44249 RepID=UPI001CAA3867|nr:MULTISPECIES: Xaa-Pro peptidase family protein [Paenibacillus]MBY9081468.1 aminopeptidase P family protein [Paenibacillus sp. CGMCC 1.18879]MBY9084988.1 aminopeptidase P family protein [Paenibacillus sinensis]